MVGDRAGLIRAPSIRQACMSISAVEQLAAAGRWAEAHNMLDSLGENPEAVACRARIWQREGHGDRARASLMAAVQQSGDPILGVELGWLQVRSGHLPEALGTFRAAWNRRPGLASALAGMAVCLERSGRAEEAFRLLDRGMVGDPPPVLGWAWGRAAVSSGNADRALVRLTRWLQGPLSASERSDLAYVLGDALDQVGDFAGAAAAYEVANVGGRPFDPELHLDAVRTMIRLFPTRGLAPSPNIVGRSLLVVGVPRSGTTLVETMLARHPQVAAGGERETWRLLALEAGERAGLQPWYREPHRLRTQDLAHLAGTYLRDLESVGPGLARVVDKMPNNILHLGLASWCLPDTVVVRCVRDEADTAWSCWRLPLGDGLPWSRSWRGLAGWIVAERLLMDHAASFLGPRLVTVRYEDLVRDPEASLRPAIEACGLPWDPRVGEHPGTERTVATASYAQVKQPLHRGAVGSSQRYHAWMGPFFAALAEFQDPGCVSGNGVAGSRGNKAGMSAGL
jgi:tetratricopeptide (TPR) repeat protein